MPRILPLFLLMGFHMVGPASARSQESQPDSARVRAARAAVMSDLRNFVVAQERNYAERQTYAPTLRDMDGLFTPSSGVTVIVLTASDRGHSEVAIHANAPGLVCAMYVGDSPPPLGRGREGRVECKNP